VSPSPCRPLRWVKFGAGIATGTFALGVAAPSWRAATVAGPYAELAAPSRLLPGLALGAFVVASWAWLVFDAALERPAPRWLLAALVGVTLAAGSAPAVFFAPSSAQRAGERLDRALAAARSEAARGLAGGDGADALHARIAAHLPPTVFVDRWLRPVPLSIAVLEGQDGPVLSPRPGDAPGTLYLALSATRDAGWLTASTLDGGRISIVRDAGRPLVLGVVACDAASPGGEGC